MGEQDPTAAALPSNKQRHALSGRLKKACGNCIILGELRTTLTELFVWISDKRRVILDRADRDKQRLFIEYPALYPSDILPYILLILHGRYYGCQGERRLPTDQDRISRHYDVAMITETETGRTALPNADLLNEVREYNLIAFRQAGEQFEKVHPGSVKLVPQTELCAVIEKDCQDMQDMALKDAPDFVWVMSQIQRAETAISESVPGPEGS